MQIRTIRYIVYVCAHFLREQNKYQIEKLNSIELKKLKIRVLSFRKENSSVHLIDSFFQKLVWRRKHQNVSQSSKPSTTRRKWLLYSAQQSVRHQTNGEKVCLHVVTAGDSCKAPVRCNDSVIEFIGDPLQTTSIGTKFCKIKHAENVFLLFLYKQ